MVHYILKPQWSSGKIYATGAWRAEFGPEGRHFWRSSEAAMGGGGAQRPVGRANGPKKTGARSARAAKTH